jgi:hypothetical protein
MRSHLGQTVEVVGLQLGWPQLEEMGIVLASQVAEYLGHTGNGLIKDQNDDWWKVADRVPVLVAESKRRS